MVDGGSFVSAAAAVEMHGKAHEPLKRQSLCLLIVAVTWLYLVASDFFGTVWPPGTAYNFFTLDFFLS